MIRMIISGSIALHRANRASRDASYVPPTGAATDEEVEDFIAHNPLYESELVAELLDPGLLGFFAKQARMTLETLRDLQGRTQAWAENESWLAAHQPHWSSLPRPPEPELSELWHPGPTEQIPALWLPTAPALALAADLIRKGGTLHSLTPRQFEELIAALCETSGWRVQLTAPSADGGIDVYTTKSDGVCGELRAIWQAKRYGPKRSVAIHQLRELAAVRDEHQATKAVIATTSRLTRNALQYVQRDQYRLGAYEGKDIERWLRLVLTINRR
jgi:hypothetical protein